MQPLKQDAIDTITQLPDDVDIDEIMYRLYVLDKIRKGQDDIAKSRIVRTEDLKREMDTW